MATLVSPGVSVTIINESFFIPVSAPTVPLFFIATNANKFQADGVTTAAYTNEYSVVRTITSLGQSVTSYGIPNFRTDGNGNSFHGDSRNEYGLFALNQYLGIGNLAYVIRANIDLTDSVITALVAGTPTFTSVTPGTASTKGTLPSVIVGTSAIAQSYNVVCTNATAPATFSVTGSTSGASTSATAGTLFNNGSVSFTISTGTTPFEVGDSYTFSVALTTTGTSLGTGDIAKRLAIVTALKAEINSNQEILSEVYEYNLILCPGYFEVANDLLALSQNVNDEAFVIADTPMTLNADDTATWAMTIARANSTSIAYYYPSGYAANLDGVECVVAASGIAIRTIAYSDNVAEIWFAPAGVNRGLVSGVDGVGYVSGTLGTATTFVETNLNQGQRDNLYQYSNNINPIVYFPGVGFIVFGQKTSSPAASALDRINVARLLMYIKRSLRKGAFPFLFEPNDSITQGNLKAAIDGFLGDILIKRGLYDFVTLCDSSNNTPTVVDNNQLIASIALKPMKAAEFIYIPITILATGATMP